MIIFSKIKAKAATGEIFNGLVSGRRKSLFDLEGWKGFELYLAGLDAATVEVKVEPFGYGEGEEFTATPEEVAYMYQRIEMRADFLESRCEKLGGYKFSFDWDPLELFN
jgi:hypothetical protein